MIYIYIRRLGKRLRANMGDVKLIVLLDCKIARQGTIWEPNARLVFCSGRSLKGSHPLWLFAFCHSRLFLAIYDGRTIVLSSISPCFLLAPRIRLFWLCPVSIVCFRVGVGKRTPLLLIIELAATLSQLCCLDHHWISLFVGRLFQQLCSCFKIFQTMIRPTT